VSLPSWFCCLPAVERAVLRSTALALPLTLFVGIPVPVWDAFWLPLILQRSTRQELFITVYGLEIVTIVELGVDVEVVRPAALPLWIEYSLLMLTPDAACLEGCSQVIFP
jgi:hypothetical protein